ncbi:hypothetical protein GR927_04210 [Mycolicibacterium sp. 3033]|nr:hypothetical protein [Mycolicibacterium aurantiacum]
MTSQGTVVRPEVLLAGFFVGFATVSLTFGVYWPFVALLPALVAGVAAIVPVKRHLEFAKGALIAAMGVVVFEFVFVVVMFAAAALH